MSLPPFSLLLPVYRGDVPAHFRRAFDSSVAEQTLRPDDVVVVRDGPVPGELAAEIDAAIAGSPVPARLLALPENGGLAAALNAGLEACRFDVVARMDADDVSAPERFEIQVSALAERGLDLVGSALFEFSETETETVGVRTPPLEEDAIRRYARFRQPFHHPTVVYRRESVSRAGGYPTDVGRFEDYVLFARMLTGGARVANVPDPLVRYRADPAAYSRRGGLGHFRDEIRLQRALRGTGLTSRVDFLLNAAVRGPYRLVPGGLRRRLYRHVAVSPPK